MSWNAEQVYALARQNLDAVFADKDGDLLGWDIRGRYYPIKQEESIDALDTYGPFTLHSGYVVIRPDQKHLMPSDKEAYEWGMYSALSSWWTEVRSSTVVPCSVTYRCSPKKPAEPEVSDDELHKLATEWTIASPDLSNFPDEPEKYKWEWWSVVQQEWKSSISTTIKSAVSGNYFTYRFSLKPEPKTPEELAEEYADNYDVPVSFSRGDFRNHIESAFIAGYKAGANND